MEKIKKEEVMERSKKEVKEFKDFAMKGNIVDMAIGVIIGGAFSKIVTSIVSDIIMPLLSVITGKIDFTNLFIALDGKQYATLELAKAAGVATLNYGLLITTIIDFLIVALSVYFVIYKLGHIGKKKEEKKETVSKKTCPYCISDISVKATRCPNCTSELK